MKERLLLLAVMVVMASGCVERTSMYYWENYSNSLYHAKKDGTPEARLEHEKTLLAIIAKAEAKGVKPPPGVCCELGFHYLGIGKKEEAVTYFDMEQTAFPESAQLVAALKKKALAPSEETL